MKPTTPYGAGKNQVMKKLITLGILVAAVVFAGTAFADGRGHALKDMQLQEHFAWSAQPAKPTASVPAHQEYPGYSDTASMR